jgi:malonyl-CoA O-methyltransferase
MNVLHEFSRFAKQYNSYNIIQNRVAQELVFKIEKNYYNSIIDIGCGSGAVYKNLVNRDIKFSEFTALDFSTEMLNLHHSSKNITKKSFDFNSIEDFNKLKKQDNQLIVSSSALQWSEDIAWTLKEISRYGDEFHFSLFTSNTFATIHKIGNIHSPIYSKEELLEVFTQYYNFSYEIKNYQLKFNNTPSMFKYIKQSGVNGKGNKLTYKEIKRIIDIYPYDYLEFEVLFVVGSVKTDH